MPKIDVKKDCFEYSIDKFIQWYKEENLDNVDGWNADFTKLKLIKLNFFLSAVNAGKESDGLLDVFDNYFAMPYGHVESDLYDHISALNKYNVTNTGISVKLESYNYPHMTLPIQLKIDSSIESLKRENKDLIKYGAFKLVELSHQWYSWVNMYNLAKMRRVNSIRIPSELIKNESKLFEIEEYAIF